MSVKDELADPQSRPDTVAGGSPSAHARAVAPMVLNRGRRESEGGIPGTPAGAGWHAALDNHPQRSTQEENLEPTTRSCAAQTRNCFNAIGDRAAATGGSLRRAIVVPFEQGCRTLFSSCAPRPVRSRQASAETPQRPNSKADQAPMPPEHSQTREPVLFNQALDRSASQVDSKYGSGDSSPSESGLRFHWGNGEVEEVRFSATREVVFLSPSLSTSLSQLPFENKALSRGVGDSARVFATPEPRVAERGPSPGSAASAVPAAPSSEAELSLEEWALKVVKDWLNKNSADRGNAGNQLFRQKDAPEGASGLKDPVDAIRRVMVAGCLERSHALALATVRGAKADIDAEQQKMKNAFRWRFWEAAPVLSPAAKEAILFRHLLKNYLGSGQGESPFRAAVPPQVRRLLREVNREVADWSKTANLERETAANLLPGCVMLRGFCADQFMPADVDLQLRGDLQRMLLSLATAKAYKVGSVPGAGGPQAECEALSAQVDSYKERFKAELQALIS